MEKKTIKIGHITCGAIFLAAGILLMISMFNDVITLKIITSLWPLILIGLGLETLYYSANKEVNVQFDFWGCMFMLLIVGLCLTAFVVNQVVINFGNYLDAGILKELVNSHYIAM